MPKKKKKTATKMLIMSCHVLQEGKEKENERQHCRCPPAQKRRHLSLLSRPVVSSAADRSAALVRAKKNIFFAHPADRALTAAAAAAAPPELHGAEQPALQRAQHRAQQALLAALGPGGLARPHHPGFPGISNAHQSHISSFSAYNQVHAVRVQQRGGQPVAVVRGPPAERGRAAHPLLLLLPPEAQPREAPLPRVQAGAVGGGRGARLGLDPLSLVPSPLSHVPDDYFSCI
mmetsp:Transcript_2595/g.3500  ORF Transcript_2595/g.3500 Transcript_2595/m.3500 type:complete len:232 (+) Transcript_2595:80-775(+)